MAKGGDSEELGIRTKTMYILHCKSFMLRLHILMNSTTSEAIIIILLLF